MNPDRFPLLAEEYARDGLNDKEICQALGICKDTFYKYLKRHPDFSDSLKHVFLSKRLTEGSCFWSKKIWLLHLKYLKDLGGGAINSHNFISYKKLGNSGI
jgi:hypothetical protein